MEKDKIRKVCITYKMIRGLVDDEAVAETCVDLPISAERYNKLAKGMTPDNKVWLEVRNALENLTFLQGYDRLGAWSIELQITMEDL
jgi:hypothetical protein